MPWRTSWKSRLTIFKVAAAAAKCLGLRQLMAAPLDLKFRKFRNLTGPYGSILWVLGPHGRSHLETVSHKRNKDLLAVVNAGVCSWYANHWILRTRRRADAGPDQKYIPQEPTESQWSHPIQTYRTCKKLRCFRNSQNSQSITSL